MASGWVKSLACKSRAFEDFYDPTPRHLISGSSCRNSAQSIKDVIETTTCTAAAAATAVAVNKKQNFAKPRNHHHRHQHENQRKPAAISEKPAKPKCKLESVSAPESRSRPARNGPEPLFPALTELPEGHPSRNVVEIIFHTSWSNKSFSGRIEMIFKVQNGSRTVTRFEEYREIVKSRAGLSCGGPTREENARCVADGNEMMRFHCLGPAGGFQDGGGGGGAWVFPGGKGATICTFSGSGGAHENAGCGKGRRAMLVCRVIAGRVSKQIGFHSLLDGRVEFDSVSGDNGELLVFDSRALLPCFLIIYKL